MSVALAPIFSTDTATDILVRIAQEVPNLDDAGRTRLLNFQIATLKYFDQVREIIA
ncbi:hypothetical protein [Azospirillum doebereinerae]